MTIDLHWKTFYESLWQFLITFIVMSVACVFLTYLIISSSCRFWWSDSNAESSKNRATDASQISHSFKVLTIVYLILLWLFLVIGYIFRILIIFFDVSIFCLVVDFMVTFFIWSRIVLHGLYLRRYCFLFFFFFSSHIHRLCDGCENI